MLQLRVFTMDRLHVVANDHLCHLIKSEGDPLYIDHLGYIV